jgi:inhibitor of KinA
MNEMKIFPLGDSALTVSFGNRISHELNEKAVGLFQYFEENQFPGLIETVPAYSSLTIFYDVFSVKKNFSEFPTAFAAVRNFAETGCRKLLEIKVKETSPIAIPVDFSPQFALDLDFVAAHNNLSGRDVIKIFTAGVYRVFMLGFMPGFAYLGEVAERISAPRKSSPRLLVPKGSVGIAGRQTGIYPFDSPGGWQIIGHTGFGLFNPHSETPCALRTGDRVRFFDANE